MIDQLQLFLPRHPLDMPLTAHGLVPGLVSFRVNERHRQAGAGVFAALARCVVTQALVKIVGPAGVQRPVSAAEDVGIARRHRTLSVGGAALAGEKVPLPAAEPGDTLAVLTTGAYNYSMASHYNCVPRPPVVMLRGGEDYVAVRRETYEDLLVCQRSGIGV